jgi:hypothetical protein
MVNNAFRQICFLIDWKIATGDYEKCLKELISRAKFVGKELMVFGPVCRPRMAAWLSRDAVVGVVKDWSPPFRLSKRIVYGF